MPSVGNGIVSRFIPMADFIEQTKDLDIDLRLLIAVGVMPPPVEQLSANLKQRGGYYDVSMSSRLTAINEAVMANPNITIGALRSIGQNVGYSQISDTVVLIEDLDAPTITRGSLKHGLSANELQWAMAGWAKTAVEGMTDKSAWIQWYLTLHAANTDATIRYLAEQHPSFGWGNLGFEAAVIGEVVNGRHGDTSTVSFLSLKYEVDGLMAQSRDLFLEMMEWLAWVDPETNLQTRRILDTMPSKSVFAMVKLASIDKSWIATRARAFRRLSWPTIGFAMLGLVLGAIACVVAGGAGSLASGSEVSFWEDMVLSVASFGYAVSRTLTSPKPSWFNIALPWVFNVSGYTGFFLSFRGGSSVFQTVLFSIQNALGQTPVWHGKYTQHLSMAASVESLLGIAFVAVGIARILQNWIPDDPRVSDRPMADVKRRPDA